jgi:hypothetical protein
MDQEKTVTQKMPLRFNIKNPFKRDYEDYEGVPRINIYLLRLLYFLMLVFVGSDSWQSLISHQGPWDHVRAVSFCVWTAYSTLSLFGMIHPLKWLPIVIFMIFYKTLWLVVVAYPLCAQTHLQVHLQRKWPAFSLVRHLLLLLFHGGMCLKRTFYFQKPSFIKSSIEHGSDRRATWC